MRGDMWQPVEVGEGLASECVAERAGVGEDLGGHGAHTGEEGGAVCRGGLLYRKGEQEGGNQRGQGVAKGRPRAWGRWRAALVGLL